MGFARGVGGSTGCPECEKGNPTPWCSGVSSTTGPVGMGARGVVTEQPAMQGEGERGDTGRFRLRSGKNSYVSIPEDVVVVVVLWRGCCC